jgi:uncharacterized caspase-like protein
MLPAFYLQFSRLVLTLTLLTVGTISQLAFAQAAERKVALVVGNANYKSSPLKNPRNDAQDMAASLKRMGFVVIERYDTSRETFALAVREFGDQLRGASVGLFYFAGHGLQVKGRNFLVPTDTDVAREDEVPYRTLDVNEVLDKMDTARTAVNFVILDACRNNPFARSFKASAVGLAQMDAPAGTLLAYATAPGSVAQDGEGRNGLYTSALLKHIATPGMPVEQMFKRVRVDVAQQSNRQQVPWESSSLSRDFSFQAALSSPAAAASTSGAPAAAVQGGLANQELAVELAFWDAIKSSTSPADFRAYLEQYPSGRFAALARNRVGAAPTAAISSATPSSATPAPSAATAAQSAAVIRWRDKLGEQAAPSPGGLAIAAQAQSPEHGYVALAMDGKLALFDVALRSMVSDMPAYTAARGSVSALSFSPSGRSVLISQQTAAEPLFTLVDISSKSVLWSKAGRTAEFDRTSAQVILQTSAGRQNEVAR